ncbi:MarR family winged helix-turn-helix transcriptional regulator [Kitasatospora sp. NPDC094015]|uniref:MarR family winged helix-turn-helix transcriptional regulator n=1 Tax=Kitasatospora sp. NPDC094015 TaxID=3155205 RepID=UPI00332DE6F5
MYDGRKGSSSPLQQTVHLLSLAGDRARRRLAERLDAQGRSPAQLAILSTLAELGPHARPDLVARADTDRAETLRTLDDLRAAGLVDHLQVQFGDRQQVVLITPAGRVALDALYAEVAAVQDDLLTRLTRGERAQLNALLRRVCATADPRGTPAADPPRHGAG